MSTIIPPERMANLTNGEFDDYVEREITYLAKVWMSDPIGGHAAPYKSRMDALIAYISFRKTQEQARANKMLVVLTGVLAAANVIIVLVALFR
jgi:hypothetical protein